MTLSTDISPKNFSFNPYAEKSLRDKLRDIADTTLRRPFYKLIYRNKLNRLPYKANLILPSKGLSILAKRRLLNRYIPLNNSRILVVGCGEAYDFGSYLSFEPLELVGVDLYNFKSCWDQIKNHTKNSKLKTKVSFHQSDIAQLEKVFSEKFDVICSDAVFEHFQDFEIALYSLYGALKPGGFIYATYGPLWYCWGGDHFSGRGGLENGYNHLLLNSSEYREYYEHHLKDPEFELQNGGRYVELDLFSKLTSKEYLDLYSKIGLKCKKLIVDIDPRAEKTITPQILNALLSKHPHLHSTDFIVKGHIIILEKEL